MRGTGVAKGLFFNVTEFQKFRIFKINSSRLDTSLTLVIAKFRSIVSRKTNMQKLLALHRKAEGIWNLTLSHVTFAAFYLHKNLYVSDYVSDLCF